MNKPKRERKLRVVLEVDCSEEGITRYSCKCDCPDWDSWASNILAAIRGVGYSEAGILAAIIEQLSYEAEVGEMSEFTAKELRLKISRLSKALMEYQCS